MTIDPDINSLAFIHSNPPAKDGAMWDSKWGIPPNNLIHLNHQANWNHVLLPQQYYHQQYQMYNQVLFPPTYQHYPSHNASQFLNMDGLPPNSACINSPSPNIDIAPMIIKQRCQMLAGRPNMPPNQHDEMPNFIQTKTSSRTKFTYLQQNSASVPSSKGTQWHSNVAWLEKHPNLAHIRLLDRSDSFLDVDAIPRDKRAPPFERRPDLVEATATTWKDTSSTMEAPMYINSPVEAVTLTKRSAAEFTWQRGGAVSNHSFHTDEQNTSPKKVAAPSLSSKIGSKMKHVDLNCDQLQNKILQSLHQLDRYTLSRYPNIPPDLIHHEVIKLIQAYGDAFFKVYLTHFRSASDSPNHHSSSVYPVTHHIVCHAIDELYHQWLVNEAALTDPTSFGATDLTNEDRFVKMAGIVAVGFEQLLEHHSNCLTALRMDAERTSSAEFHKCLDHTSKAMQHQTVMVGGMMRYWQHLSLKRQITRANNEAMQRMTLNRNSSDHFELDPMTRNLLGRPTADPSTPKQTDPGLMGAKRDSLNPSACCLSKTCASHHNGSASQSSFQYTNEPALTGQECGECHDSTMTELEVESSQPIQDSWEHLTVAPFGFISFLWPELIDMLTPEIVATVKAQMLDLQHRSCDGAMTRNDHLYALKQFIVNALRTMSTAHPHLSKSLRDVVMTAHRRREGGLKEPLTNIRKIGQVYIINPNIPVWLLMDDENKPIGPFDSHTMTNWSQVDHSGLTLGDTRLVGLLGDYWIEKAETPIAKWHKLRDWRERLDESIGCSIISETNLFILIPVAILHRDKSIVQWLTRYDPSMEIAKSTSLLTPVKNDDRRNDAQNVLQGVKP